MGSVLEKEKLGHLFRPGSDGSVLGDGKLKAYTLVISFQLVQWVQFWKRKNLDISFDLVQMVQF